MSRPGLPVVTPSFAEIPFVPASIVPAQALRLPNQIVYTTGTIISDTVWIAAESPYVINGNLTVAAGATLTIEPGMVVKVEASFAGLIIDGQLLAQGASGNQIAFTSLRDDSIGGDTNATLPGRGDWIGIRLRNNGQATLDYVQIRYAGRTPGNMSNTLLITLPTATTVYTDPGVTGVVSTSNFYQVRPLGNGGPAANSNEVGEIDYALNNAGGLYSLISLPFSTTAITDAASLTSYIGEVGALLKWNPTTQAFRFFVPPSTDDNFPLAPGEIAFVQVNSGGPSVVTMVGEVISVQHTLETGGFNFISLPLQRADLTDTASTAADITNVDAMLGWNEATQTFRFFVPPATGDNFTLQVGTPFIIDLGIGGPSLWP